MSPCQSLEAALEAIRDFSGSPEEFELAIDNSLLDPSGLNMAIMTDAVLERGWEPDGFEDKDDHRLYRYRAMG
jgi:hypothetical protein